MRYRIVAALVAALMATATAAVLAQGERFPDVNADNPHYEDIEWVAKPVRGYFGGYPDGSFKPDRTITPAQMERVLRRAFSNGMSRAEFASFIVGGIQRMRSAQTTTATTQAATTTTTLPARTPDATGSGGGQTAVSVTPGRWNATFTAVNKSGGRAHIVVNVGDDSGSLFNGILDFRSKTPSLWVNEHLNDGGSLTEGKAITVLNAGDFYLEVKAANGVEWKLFIE